MQNSKLKYFELTCTIYLKKNIYFKKSFEIISKYISYSICKNSDLKHFHIDNNFKYYTFGSFFKPEKDKIYKKDNIYKFNIRSLNKDFILQLSKDLRKNINNPYFQVFKTCFKTIKQFYINRLYSVTPIIVTTDNKQFWTVQKDGDIFKLQKQLHNNLLKKYQTFFNTEVSISNNFINYIKILNKTPHNIEISKNNKIIKFFGNKLEIIPNEDKISQDLAFIALATGLGEKNSYGGGFCLWK